MILHRQNTEYHNQDFPQEALALNMTDPLSMQ